MEPLPSTSRPRMRSRAPAALLGLGILVAVGCLVTDKDLPCRRDCHCPSAQPVCKSGTCKAGNKDTFAQGEAKGTCNPNGSCASDSLACHPDECGGSVCRLKCSRSSPQCASGEVCEDIRTGQIDAGEGIYPDAGVTLDEGVCVP